MTDNGIRPIHSGEALREELLIPFGLSARAPATALQVPAPRINDIFAWGNRIDRCAAVVDTQKPGG
jgi:plasmid maintenance system antidote protein VapI